MKLSPCLNEKCRNTDRCQLPITCSGAGPEVDAAIQSAQWKRPNRRSPIPLPTDFGIEGPRFPDTRAARGDDCMRAARNLALMMVLAVTAAWLGPALEDHSWEYDAADDLQAAQHQAQAALRRDLAAARICREQYGEAGYTWTQDGRLVCLPRRGRAVLTAEGAQ